MPTPPQPAATVLLPYSLDYLVSHRVAHFLSLVTLFYH